MDVRKDIEEAIDKIEPEKSDGKIEYKLKLLHVDEERIEGLTSQMSYRMNEGGGECIYVLGVADSGGIVGITDDEFKVSYNVLKSICDKNSYIMTLLSKKVVSPHKNIFEYFIRATNTKNYLEVKVGIAGNVDSGKSTFLGVLLTGINDDGRGKSRLNVFNYAHEVKTGRTSSIAQHIIGFDAKGDIVNHDDSFGKREWPDIISNSLKIVSLFDLCGHEKYLKTTITGLSSNIPDVCLIIVGGNMGVTSITKEHIFLCLSLGIPFIILITKIDICKDRQKVLAETVDGVKKIIKLPGIKKIPIDVLGDDDITLAVKNIYSNSVVPIFYVSNVTGEGMDKIKIFFNLLGKNKDKIYKERDDVLLHIENTFHITGIGTVVGGQLLSGSVKVGDKLLWGPNNDNYETVQVRSIHCKRVPMDEVKAGSYICIGLKKVQRGQVHRGNVLISPSSDKLVVREFQAIVSVLKTHSTTIKIGYEPVIHTRSIRQSAKIISISEKKNGRGEESDSTVLRTGDRALVRFRFSHKAEYVKPGYKILLAEGKVKVIGTVKEIF